jgi:hypothetical protein
VSGDQSSRLPKKGEATNKFHGSAGLSADRADAISDDIKRYKVAVRKSQLGQLALITANADPCNYFPP